MITINKAERIDKDNVYTECVCDTTADLDDLPSYAKVNEMQHGSICICQETMDVYMMHSDYSWSKM